MTKRLSKTLAGQIADSTLTVINPQNRLIALTAALSRHGFARPAEQPELADRTKVIAWLLETYSPRS
ncbi:hypothetical protein [Devosia psychrophila]|uniref:Uncharacterized protein n=1 Tax=Devosia psychrophila TaxID=728005 RepID=A0A1I1PPW4_9HYPH|nr:hypothetical protein [Devosia psychrophila]SFD08040.1 hypothetical protein SAMN04488059_12016 [Devosia psychrophila]